jgi:hypothetical protein
MDATELGHRVEAVRVRAARREVHSARTASALGLALGVSFGICFATGVWSHLQQHPPSWLILPLGPTGLYRTTQGLHVISGLASVPLLLAKLYVVSPQLPRRPDLRDPLGLMERVALIPLVGGSLFLLASGAANIAQWYPWRLFFPVAHWWAAWLVLGATIIHVALKAPTVRESLRRHRSSPTDRDPVPGEMSRRALFLGVAGAATLLTLLTAGQTVPWLRRTTALAPRRPDIGPQGLPVNRSAEAAGTAGLASDGSYRLLVLAASGTVHSFGLDELRQLPWRTEDLAISCVEGWSAMATWSGVAVRDLLAHAGLEPADVTVRSAQTKGGYRSSTLSAEAVRDPRCLLALEVNGQPLAADHGAPLRLVAPNRPGVAQTKWVDRVELA